MASCTACTRLSGLAVAGAGPSTAALATATAVVAEEARRFSTIEAAREEPQLRWPPSNLKKLAVHPDCGTC